MVIQRAAAAFDDDDDDNSGVVKLEPGTGYLFNRQTHGDREGVGGLSFLS